MVNISLTSTTGTGFLETDFDQIKDLLQDGGVEVTSSSPLAMKNATIQTKSANYTLVAGDNNNIIEVDTTSTITLPDGLDTGFQAVIVNTGSAQTITLSATTTLTSKDSNTTITSQYGAVTVVHVGSNVWRAFGDLT